MFKANVKMQFFLVIFVLVMKQKSKNNNEYIDKIISMLSATDGTLKLLDISKAFGFKSDTIEYDELKDVLNMLVQQKVISKSSRKRYFMPQPDYTNITGILKTEGKHIFIDAENLDIPIVSIYNRCLNTAMVGDKVIARIIASKNKKNKKLKGEVIEIVERNTNELTGFISYQCDNYYLVPDDKALRVDFLISKKNLNGAKDGDIVNAKFISWNDPNNSPTAKVVDILGKKNVIVAEYNQIVKEFNLPTEFSNAVINEANNFKPPQNRKLKDRLDLRNERVITIDPTTAKDFDDALSLTKLENGNYYLGVHIADVSHYVKENSELDIEAEKRGNSVYLVDKVIPMLPERLSNEICSLNPNVVRYTFSVMMEINDNLKIVDYLISPSIIKSCRRFTYNEVQNIIDNNEGDEKDLVLELNFLAKRFREYRIENGSINYNTKETKYILDDNLCPVSVERNQTTDSTALIEEFMLLANKQVAIHLKKISKQYNSIELLPFIYRVHDAPQEETIDDALAVLKSLGVKFKKTNSIPKTLNSILAQVKYTLENDFVNQILIRSMPKAIYSPVNIGHFGLGFTDYAHFTSPIRRYADLLVHRLLKEYADGLPTNKRINRLHRDLSYIANHISNTERTATDAERTSNKLASVIYAKSLLGDVFEGSVSGVQAFGIFVILDDIYVEGHINKNNLPKDNYEFDGKKMKLSGNRQSYSFGNRVKVRIVRADINRRQIDLVIEE